MYYVFILQKTKLRVLQPTPTLIVDVKRDSLRENGRVNHVFIAARRLYHGVELYCRIETAREYQTMDKIYTIMYVYVCMHVCFIACGIFSNDSPSLLTH